MEEIKQKGPYRSYLIKGNVLLKEFTLFSNAKMFRSQDTGNELQILPGQTEKEPPSGEIYAGYKYRNKNIFYQSEANQ